MNLTELQGYQTPLIEVIEVAIESGYATSNGNTNDYGWGGNLTPSGN